MPRSIGHNIKPPSIGSIGRSGLNLSNKPKMNSVECRILPGQKRGTEGWELTHDLSIYSRYRLVHLFFSLYPFIPSCLEFLGTMISF